MMVVALPLIYVTLRSIASYAEEFDDSEEKALVEEQDEPDNLV